MTKPPQVTARQIWEMVLSGRTTDALSVTRDCREAQYAGQHSSAGNHRRRALFVEPALSSCDGHHYHLATHYESLLVRLGFETTVVHAFRHKLDLPPGWVPYFLVPHHTLACRGIKTEQDLQAVEQYFVAEYLTLLRRFQPEVLILGTMRFTNVAALATALAKAGSIRPRFTLLGVLETDLVPDCDRPVIALGAFRRAAALLSHACIPHKVIVETNTVRNSLVNSGFSEDNIHAYQYVAAQRLNRGNSPLAAGDGQVRIGYLGGSRRVRNPDLIAQLLCSVQFDHATSWHVQLDLDYLEQRCAATTVAQLRQLHADGALELYKTGLDESEYQSLFTSLDLVVLPYSKRYRIISSGILVEAIYANVIPVMPRDSSMFALYTSLGAQPPAFDELTLSSVFHAIKTAVSQIEELRCMATAVRERWQNHPQSAEQWQEDLRTWL